MCGQRGIGAYFTRQAERQQQGQQGPAGEEAAGQQQQQPQQVEPEAAGGKSKGKVRQGITAFFQPKAKRGKSGGEGSDQEAR